jgi:hypothetical protein
MSQFDPTRRFAALVRCKNKAKFYFLLLPGATGVPPIAAATSRERRGREGPVKFIGARLRSVHCLGHELAQCREPFCKSLLLENGRVSRNRLARDATRTFTNLSHVRRGEDGSFRRAEALP